MAEGEFPESVSKSLKMLGDLPEDKMEIFLTELKKPVDTVSQKVYVNALSKKIGIEGEDLQFLLMMVTIVFPHEDEKLVGGKSRLDFVLEAMPEAERLNEQQVRNIKERLPKLLNMRSIKIFDEIGKVYTNHAIVLRSTELRSKVFPLGRDFEAGLLLYELKIIYNESDKEKQIYFTMDSKDIKDLRLELMVAEKKAEELKRSSEAKGIKLIENR